ncbi:hypothetical protein ASE04_04615 [Rhizobium sp. Root708]|uniref:hypothetical protein n=1 Tax=Rhizobium sp. Root708 TaxID=1736592 RepID=UPI0006F35D99|nr:hypothetical protein [Rhizobium sp. Root708]KRB55014.1 hypothetical protein ASE04_04615 [Rhizobium sp. Root708]
MTTLEELIDRTRLDLADESLGVRRSWEDMFRYTLKHYPKETPLDDFDVKLLEARFRASNMNPPVVDGYAKRWRDLLQRSTGV